MILLIEQDGQTDTLTGIVQIRERKTASRTLLYPFKQHPEQMGELGDHEGEIDLNAAKVRVLPNG